MQTTEFFFEKRSVQSLSKEEVFFYGLHLYIVWGSLTLANIGCTNQEWNEQHTARNVLILHFAKKNIFSSINNEYELQTQP